MEDGREVAAVGADLDTLGVVEERCGVAAHSLRRNRRGALAIRARAAGCRFHGRVIQPVELHHAVECRGHDVAGVGAGQEGDAKDVEIMHGVNAQRRAAAVRVVPEHDLQA